MLRVEDYLIEKQEAKTAYLMKIANLVIIAISAGLLVFYIAIKSWGIASIELALLIVGLLSTWYCTQKNFKAVTYISIPLFFIVICFKCLFFDVPNATVPRAVHNYLLPLAVYAFILTQDKSRYLKYVMPVSILLTYLVLGCTKLGFNSSILDNETRLIMVWIHNTVAVSVLCISVFIVRSEHNIRVALELELSKAILKRELEVYFQPQVDATGTTIGAEALVRWEHPIFGTIMPDTFIATAEQTDLILHLGRQVLEAACNQLASWAKDANTAHLTLSVNLSVKQFQDPALVQNIAVLLEDTEINPQKLKLEVTESVFVNDLEVVSKKMTQLKALGIKFSLDDFGTGYSSLTYLRYLPLSELKIDKSFIKDVLSNTRDAAIAKMIISLAKELNVAVIAEGVETAAQRIFLIEHGCLNFQGYLYSRPLPAARFNEFVINQSNNPP